MAYPSHILLDLRQVVPKEEMLAQPERFLRVVMQFPRNGSLRRFLIKWKDYHEDEVSRELENEFRETCLNFVIEDNDLIREGKSIMD